MIRVLTRLLLLALALLAPRAANASFYESTHTLANFDFRSVPAVVFLPQGGNLSLEDSLSTYAAGPALGDTW